MPDSAVMQTPIPTLFMRGGTSHGPFFNAADLPTDQTLRDRVLLAVMGSPDKRQIDGLGGAHPLTSKVGMVGPGQAPGVDLNFLFAQLTPERDTVDTTANCGNMLAAVVPFALETGMVKPQGDTSTFRVLTLNTGMQCDITVETPGGRVRYGGAARIDGVPGTAAPVAIRFLETAGSVCAGLLPTGQPCDEVDVEGVGRLTVTCIDNGMPMVLLRAADVGRRGDESVKAMNEDTELKAMLEALRLHCGVLMELGDVSAKPYPKMCLLAPSSASNSIVTRCFIPHVCHDAIGVLAAVTVATACVIKGSVAQTMARFDGVGEGNKSGTEQQVSIEHPSGEFSLVLDLSDPNSAPRAALLRTARLIMRGDVMVPAAVWQP